MKKRPRILLDIDGVVCDFTKPVLKLATEITGKTFDVNDITGWDICAALGMTESQYAIIDHEIKREEFCLSLEAYDGAADFVNELRQFADVYAVTAPYDSKHWVGERGKWLQRKLDFKRNEIVYTDAKILCAGDALIDDKTSTINAWKAEYPHKYAVLFDRPWNRHDNVISRVVNYQHALTFLRGVL